MHMHHPQHGTISIGLNPGTSMYEVKHNGSYAGMGGQRGIFPDKKQAAGHARQYMQSLVAGHSAVKPMYNRPSPQAQQGKFGKNEQASNANQPMSEPAKGPNLDPEKTKQFMQGFQGALGFGTKKTETGLRRLIKKPVNEPLAKPYRSEAQRRWAHTDAGKQALGGEKAVAHWDRETKGKKLPEKVKKSFREAFGHQLRKEEGDGPKIKPDVPAQQDAGESYNPKLERPNQRQRVKSYLEEMKASPEQRPISFSVSNAKLAKDGIASFNLPAVETCPGAGKCAKYCYADTGSFLRFYKTTMPPRVSNWLASQKDDFSDRAIDYLNQWKQSGKHPESGKRFPLKAVRIHDSGDFYSPKYVDHWTKIAKAHPDVQFYAYTKSHHPVLKGRLAEMAALPNVNIVQSLGSKYDHLVDPDKPHAVVFESPEQMKAAGYADAMASDLTAADKRNTKVGLYIHGSSGGAYQGLDDPTSAATQSFGAGSSPSWPTPGTWPRTPRVPPRFRGSPTRIGPSLAPRTRSFGTRTGPNLPGKRATRWTRDSRRPWTRPRSCSKPARRTLAWPTSWPSRSRRSRAFRRGSTPTSRSVASRMSNLSRELRTRTRSVMLP
jgi:hypothetical protein